MLSDRNKVIGFLTLIDKGNSVVRAQATLIRFWVIVALAIIALAVILMLLAVIGSYIYKKIKRSP